MNINDARITEILELISEEMTEGRGPLEEYGHWDDLIELDGLLSFEEWEWACEHVSVEITARAYLSLEGEL